MEFKSAGKDDAIIKLVGVDDRNAAESFRGATVYAEKSEIKVPKGKFFIADVIGSKLILSSGKELGTVEEITSGNVDYYRILTAEGYAVFPLIKELSAKIDIENKTVTVDAKEFTRVVFYEN